MMILKVALCLFGFSSASAAAFRDGNSLRSLDDASTCAVDSSTSTPPPMKDALNPYFIRQADGKIIGLSIKGVTEPLPSLGRLQNDSCGRLVWTNYVGLTRFSLDGYLEPKSVQEVQQVVQTARKEKNKLRVVGSGHADVPLVEPGKGGRVFLVSLDKMPKGVIEVDNKRQVARVWAGTQLRQVNTELWGRGYSLLSFPEYDIQTVGGATSTSTHGSDYGRGTLSSNIVGLTLVDGTGTLLKVKEDDPDIGAYRQALGALGVIVEVEMKVVPKVMLQQKKSIRSKKDALKDISKFMSQALHVGLNFNWLDDTSVFYAASPTSSPRSSQEALDQKSQRFSEFGTAMTTMSALAAANTTYMATAANTFEAMDASPQVDIVDFYYRVATSNFIRGPVQENVEYFLPAQAASDAIAEITKLVKEHDYKYIRSNDVRIVRAEDHDVWLSPASSVPAPTLGHWDKGAIKDLVVITAFEELAVKGEGYREAVEETLIKHGGRSHSAKQHRHVTKDWDTLVKYFPKLPKFLGLRKTRDPDDIFLNEWLKGELLVEEFERREAAK